MLVVHTSAFTAHRSVILGKLWFVGNFNSNIGKREHSWVWGWGIRYPCHSDKPEFSQYNRPMGCKGTCMDYKPHWVSNSLDSVGFCEKPARVGTDTLQYYTEISIFGHFCTPVSRKPEFSRQSQLCGLKVHTFYCKSH